MPETLKINVAPQKDDKTNVTFSVEIVVGQFQSEFLNYCVKEGILEPFDRRLEEAVRDYMALPFELLKSLKEKSTTPLPGKKRGRKPGSTTNSKVSTKAAPSGNPETVLE